MNHETPAAASASQTVGPFFHLGLKPQRSAAHDSAADRVRLAIKVTDGDGRPVDDALVELWTAAEFARMPTGGEGSCELDIVQAPHINVCLFARGLLRQLHTRIYFAGDRALASDAVLALVPEHRRNTLLAGRDPQMPGRWLFHIRLQGSEETVFFDV